MLRLYTSFGFDPAGFWAITPREVAARIEGALRRLEGEYNARIVQAWYTAALTRAATLPSLSDLLSGGAPVDQSPAAQEINLDQIFLAWGGDPAALVAVRAQRIAENGE